MDPISAAAAVQAIAVPVVKLALPPLIKTLNSILGGDVTSADMKNLDGLVRYEIAELIKDASSNALVGSSLLENLNAAALKLEDLLSKYEYGQIKNQVSPPTPIKKLIPASMLPKSSLKEGLEELIMYVEQVRRILVPSTANTTHLLANIITPTTSALSSSYFGREKHCNRIIKFLLDESQANEVPVIAITGIKGSGKTHTAQYIRKDDRIKEQFKNCIWVDVGDNFDVVVLTKEMIESATNKECPMFRNFDTLQRILVKSLSEGTKTLFVFDNVCGEDKMKWDILRSPLNEAAQNGSKIIITTQNKIIAGRLGVEVIDLGKLDDHECWSIIRHYASEADDRQKMTNDEGLLYVKNEVINKLKESPRALMAVAHSRRDDKSAAMHYLLNRYSSLSTDLQECFAYCSLFPKGYKFRIDFNKQEPHLISLWIANGFIKSTGGLTLEKEGMKHFDELVSQSFFERKSEDYFVVPDLLHDLAERISKRLCHRVEGLTLPNIPASCIHLSFCTTENFASPSTSDMKAELSKLTNLRSLIILCDRFSTSIFQNGENILKNLDALRALYVCPDPSIGVLSKYLDNKLLKYLHVQHDKKLPEPLAKLYLLRVFILITNRVKMLLNDCKYLEEETLPRGFDKLIELRTLIFYAVNGKELDYLYYNSKCINVRKLKLLQNLMAFHPEKDGDKGMIALSELSLSGSLSVLNLEKVQSKVEAEKAALNRKESLNELIFEWSSTSNNNSNICEVVLDGLRPHENLIKLKVVGYKGTRFPDWMNGLPHLQTLTLQSGTSFEISPLLPPSRQCLEVSDSHGLLRLSFVGDAGHNLILYDCLKSSLPSIFQRSCAGLCMLTIKVCSIDNINLFSLNNLKHLYLVRLPNVRIISNLSPAVMHLTIKDCPELRSVQNLLHCTSLERLEIKKCPMLLVEGLPMVEVVVRDRLPQAKHIETDEPLLVLKFVQQEGFRSIQGLALFGSNRHFPDTLVQNFHQLSSLRRLVLIDFRTLPNLGMLSSLAKLNISDCPYVESLPVLPHSLQSITLRKCPRLKVNYEEGSPDRSTISHIPDIRIYN